jgi:hypothetical protein
VGDAESEESLCRADADACAPRPLTLALPKTGLARVPGEICVADIGIPPELYEKLGISLGPVFGGAYWIPITAVP